LNNDVSISLRASLILPYENCRICARDLKNMSTSARQSARSSWLALNLSLWVAQALIALAFVGIGAWKLSAPIDALAAAIKWPGEYPSWFVRGLGVIDVAGGFGIVAPQLTGIWPRLTVWAAVGCVALQVCAIAFHGSRAEFSVLPLNFILLPLAGFVLWGRSRQK
jgi:hypothetical protein